MSVTDFEAVRRRFWKKKSSSLIWQEGHVLFIISDLDEQHRWPARIAHRADLQSKRGRRRFLSMPTTPLAPHSDDLKSASFCKAAE
jgi:hypothetical protein